MFCHVPMYRSNILRPIRVCCRRLRLGAPIFRPVVSALRFRHRTLLPLHHRSALPAARFPGATGPFVARVSRGCTRARLCASCAGARFARGRKRPPDAAPDFRSRFILTRFAEMQAPLPDFSYFHRRSRISGSPEFAAPASIRCLLPTLRPGCGEECRAREASAEPDQPDGDVEAVFLRAFEHVVLVGPLFPVR